MAHLDLSPDALLTTTRSVRKRLDLSRPVEPDVIRECLELAVQAPTGSNRQGWHFIVVSDPQQRRKLADLYARGGARYMELRAQQVPATTPGGDAEIQERVFASAQYLIEHLHEVPVHVIPCIEGRTDTAPLVAQASQWGSILPATWSFMLAARSRGLGTAWTTFHLFFEREAADVLGIPYESVTQAALIPVAYTIGTDFKPGPRKPLDSVLHWEHW
jgi:nitroreductase